MPISALLINDEIFEAIASQSGEQGVFGHGYTYSAHPVATAVALETLKIYDEIDIVGQVKRVSPHFLARMDALGAHPLVGDARGVGLVCGMELMRDKAKREPFDASLKIGERVQNVAQEHGLITRGMGDRMALCPPLIITESEIDEIFDKLATALDEVNDALTREGQAAAE